MEERAWEPSTMVVCLAAAPKACVYGRNGKILETALAKAKGQRLQALPQSHTNK